MKSRKLTGPALDIVKNIVGFDDEQIKGVEENPKQFEMCEKMPVIVSKKLVATCVEAKNCGLHKIGDRYVFNAVGHMIKEETCEKPCLFALSSFLPFIYISYDRAASGLELNRMHFEYIACPDTGCKYGGWGTSMFKLSVEDA